MISVLTLDDALAAGGIAAELFCAGCLIWRGLHRQLPALTAYTMFLAAAESGAFLSSKYADPYTYFYVYVAVTFLGYAFELVLMRELAIKKLDAFDGRARVWVNAAIVICFVSFIGIALVISGNVMHAYSSASVNTYLDIDLGFCFFRVLAFGMILFLSRILFTGAYDIVDEVASWLAIYAVATLVTQVLHEYEARGAAEYSGFEAIERVRMLWWCVTMAYLGSRILIKGRLPMTCAEVDLIGEPRKVTKKRWRLRPQG